MFLQWDQKGEWIWGTTELFGISLCSKVNWNGYFIQRVCSVFWFVFNTSCCMSYIHLKFVLPLCNTLAISSAWGLCFQNRKARHGSLLYWGLMAWCHIQFVYTIQCNFELLLKWMIAQRVTMVVCEQTCRTMKIKW